MTFPAHTCTALLKSFVKVPLTLARYLSTRIWTSWWGGLPSRMTRRRIGRSSSLVTAWYLPSCLPRLIESRVSTFGPFGPGVLDGILALCLMIDWWEEERKKSLEDLVERCSSNLRNSEFHDLRSCFCRVCNVMYETARGSLGCTEWLEVCRTFVWQEDGANEFNTRFRTQLTGICQRTMQQADGEKASKAPWAKRYNPPTRISTCSQRSNMTRIAHNVNHSEQVSNHSVCTLSWLAISFVVSALSRDASS